MATFRNVSADVREVTYGNPRPARVGPDEVIEVDDYAAEAYEQPGIWVRVSGASSEQPASPEQAIATAPSAEEA